MKLFLHIFLRGFIGLAFAAAAPAGGAESDLCAPFKQGMVDQSAVARMLGAAKDGDLYRIEPSLSEVGFCVDSPVGRVKGQFKDFKGGLTFASTATAAGDQQAMVMVDTKSLETDTPLIDGMLKGEQFFDVTKYPEMLFVSRQFHWVNSSEAVLIGDLTLHGVTREVGLHVQLMQKEPVRMPEGGEQIWLKATTLISREQFGLDALSPMVSDLVSLCMRMEAVRYRANEL